MDHDALVCPSSTTLHALVGLGLIVWVIIDPLRKVIEENARANNDRQLGRIEMSVITRILCSIFLPDFFFF